MKRDSVRLFSIIGFLFVSACGSDAGSLVDSVTHVSRAQAQAPHEADGSEANKATAQSAAGSASAHETSQATDKSAPAPNHTTWKGMRVGTNFWFLNSWAEQAWKANVDFSTTDDPWNPAFISDLEEADYAVYRFMDFGGTNNSKLSDWAHRTQMNSQTNQTAGDIAGNGIAYEWMFDLCNRMQKDCWINVPHLAIESYEKNPNQNFFTELAKLAKEKLDPGLTLYVEYSNETWNYGFEQAQYLKTRGTALNYDVDPYASAFKFHVYASSRLNDAFVKVYGKDISRVKWVISGQLGQPYGTQKQLDALKDPKINLGSRMPAYYSVSNYVGSDNNLDGNSPTIVQDFQKEIQTTLQWADETLALTSKTPMKLVAYEGGQSLFKNADVFSRNPAIYALYEQWLTAVSTRYVLTNHYANSGAYVPAGAWGAKEKTGQPIATAPKARALRDWIKAHPTE